MRYSLVAMVWLGLITHVTVSGLAPAFLNADVILNSVMSLQNITPFYWGQNRLLNVVPLLAWPIRDPALNLLAILYLNTGLYYLVLWTFARGAVALTAVHAQSREWLTTAVFVSLSSAALLILTPQATFELALWHHEYTLPLVLLGAALLLAHRNPVRASAGKTWLMALCLFVAAFVICQIADYLAIGSLVSMPPDRLLRLTLLGILLLAIVLGAVLNILLPDLSDFRVTSNLA